MKITQRKVTVREVYDGYQNNHEEGVVGYGGRLDIRPKYQREFVYKLEQQEAVIRSVMHSFPLNVFYWAKIRDDQYEILDGQQRTLSLCEYINGGFSVNNMYFANLPADQQDLILDYILFVYVCDGTDSEKLDWFKIINIAGEPLTNQELRNAVYAGPWLIDAKRYFSKTGCAAKDLAEDYLKGIPLRQDYLETALLWIADKEGTTIEAYMAKHQLEPTVIELWTYFQAVISWVQAVFPQKRSVMCGLPWGIYYNQHGHRTDLDPKVLEDRIQELLADEDVTKKSGIYEYLLTGKERLLNIRVFDKRDKLAAYNKQGGKCAICGKPFDFNDMQGDHIIPWSKGGKTVPDNCQMLCTDCNLRKRDN